jgi:ABC-2 type transport system permease protein
VRFLRFSLRFFLNEIREFEVFFWSIVFPLVLYFFLSAVLGGTGNSSSEGMFKLGIVREEAAAGSQTPVELALKRLCGEDRPFEAVPLADRETALKELKGGKVDAVLVIPSGTADAEATAFTPAGTGIPLEVLQISGREGSRVAANVLKAGFDRANLEVGKALNPRHIPVVSEERSVTGQGRRIAYKDYIFPSVALLMMLSVGLFNSPQGLIFFRVSGTNRKLLSTPLRSWEYFGAHLAKLFLTMLIALALLYAMAGFLYGVGGGIFSAGFIASMLLGMAVLVSFGLMLASFATRESTAIVLGQTFYQVMMFLGGFYFPVLGLPWALRWIVYVIPTSYLVELGRRNMGLATNDLPFALLIGVPVAWLLISATVFSFNFRKVMGYE